MREGWGKDCKEEYTTACAPLAKHAKKKAEPPRGPIPPVRIKQEARVQCGKLCTTQPGGACGRACWLTAGHCENKQCAHACRNCWAVAPGHVTCQKDSLGRPTIRPVEVHHGLERENNEPTKPGIAKKLTAKLTKQIGEFAGWFVAETKGKWSRRIHAAEVGTGARQRKCACQVSFRGRRMKMFSELRESPVGSNICANCFRQLSAEMWNFVITQHAELVPQAWTKLTGN